MLAEYRRLSFAHSACRVKKNPPISIPFVIAVDGPAAAGKGTLTRALATHFGYERLDSGRLYRSVAQQHVVDEWHAFPESSENSQQSINADIQEIIQAVCTRLPLTRAYLAKIDKDRSLDEDNVSLFASLIAQNGTLRAALRDKQRAYIAAVATGIVLDGRDMGTVICPDAPCKIFLTASLETRAARRAQEMLDAGAQGSYNVQLNTVLKAMRVRDARDVSRLEAPLREAEDAMILDSSKLSVLQVLEQALRHVEACQARFVS